MGLVDEGGRTEVACRDGLLRKGEEERGSVWRDSNSALSDIWVLG
jgi:hypothetical protein